jgi:hypothetical protein
MMLDATGAEQIRDAFATAADTAGEHTDDVAGLAWVLAEGAETYAGLGMAASTVDHLRDAAASTTAAQASLGEAGERLQAALGDFNARDGRVAEAVADAGNLMLAEGYAQTFTLPDAVAAVPGGPAVDPDRPDKDGKQEPETSPADYLLALEDIRNGMAWMSNNEGNPYWRPSTLTPELSAQLTDDDAADQAAEAQGLPSPDRPTCYTHQSWLADCIGDPSHSSPGLADKSVPSYNWCADHRLPVQVCQCWPATVDGTPLAVSVPA